jgi:hypothetical protein
MTLTKSPGRRAQSPAGKRLSRRICFEKRKFAAAGRKAQIRIAMPGELRSSNLGSFRQSTKKCANTIRTSTLASFRQ